MSAQAPIIIIGTGLAGYSLAREFRKLDKETPLLLISRDDAHSYSKPMLSTGFTKGKSADELSMANPGKMAEQLAASIRSFCEVEHIDVDQKKIFIGNEHIDYQALVLATGASVNRLNFPGAEHEWVFSINDLMDYRAFRSALQEKQHVLLMGAGLIGCEYANDLIIGGHKVTVVDPSSQVLNGLIPEFAGAPVKQALEEEGGDIRMGVHVTEIEENTGRLLVRLSDGDVVTCDRVISAVGLRPDITLAKKAGIACNRGIIADRLLQTSAPSVYALGDCAEVDGKVMLYVLPLMAAARALAKTLAGQETQVVYGVMPIATKTPACPVVVCPPSSTEGQWEVEQHGKNTRGLFKNNNGDVLGFVLTGDCVSEKQSLAKLCPPVHHD